MALELQSNLALIKFSGSDAGDFLQGQLTNDIKDLSIQDNNRGNWQLSGYCNPKGRLIALFTLWQENNEYFAIIDKSLIEATCKRLNMFVMRSKVTIEHLEDTTIFGGLSIDSLAESNISEFKVKDLQDGELIYGLDATILAYSNRFLIIVKSKTDHHEKYKPGNSWQTADILDGLPQVTADSTELFVPQMVNLDLLGGVNFKKGCYTGQEIVARMHYLGKAKKRMFVCKFDSSDNSVYQAGDKVYADSQLSKAVGSIVNTSSQTKIALAVLQLGSVDKVLYLNEETKICVTDSQPYQQINE